MLMSRAQWYVFTTVRTIAFIVLVWTVGNWVDRAVASSIGKAAIGFGVVTIGAAVINTWVVRYETYLDDEKKRRSGR